MTTLQNEYDTEVAQISNQMDIDLGLYIPADVKPHELLQYDEFFMLCRKLFFIYSLATKEETVKLFIEFYNKDFIGKEEQLNELKNTIRYKIEEAQTEEELDPEAYSDYLTTLYLSKDTDQAKANLLYYLNKGYIPNTEEDTKVYQQLVSEINEDLQTIFDYEEIQQSTTSALVEPKEFETPEEVVSRYLKGSGVYDPATRNSGFRVDTDIEK